MNRLIILLLVVLTSCTTLKEVNTLNKSKMNGLLGQKIEIVGTAVNTKLGALIIAKDSTSIWIDEIESWLTGYYLEGLNGKTLKVTGTVIEKYDLPVFIYKEGDSRSGIPVPEGTDLKEASHRYLLKNAKWEIISK